MTVKKVIPRPLAQNCVQWDGTNLQEIVDSFPTYVFSDIGGPLTVSGQGVGGGTVPEGWWILGVNGFVGLAFFPEDPSGPAGIVEEIDATGDLSYTITGSE